MPTTRSSPTQPLAMLRDLLGRLRTPDGRPGLPPSPAPRVPGPAPLDVLLDGFRRALGLTDLALYRADGDDWVLTGTASEVGRTLRPRVRASTGVLLLQQRAPDGRVSVAADQLRPEQLPFSGGAAPTGTLSLAPADAGAARLGLWLALAPGPLPQAALAVLNGAVEVLLDLDAQARRIASLEAWNQLLAGVYRFGEALRHIEAAQAVVEQLSGLLETLVGPHRLAVLELTGERAGEARLLGVFPGEAWPATWPLPDPVPRDGLAAETLDLARARAQALLPDEAGAWFTKARGWYVEGVSPSPLLSVAFVVTATDELAFATAELRSLLALATRAAAEHLHELVVLDRLKSLAIADHLTGVHNKRYFLSRLAEEVQRARRHGLTFALVMFDLDHFKRVNDTHGHDAGDAVLREVGALLRRLARGDDVAARYGGEEFVVLMPGTDQGGAHAFAERLRAGAAALDVVVRATHVRVTISAGVGTYPDAGTSGDDLLHAVDAALYRAKQGGRNRVELAGGTP